MNSFFTKQPILDSDGKTYGYEILSRGALPASRSSSDEDKLTADLINDLFFSENYRFLLEDKRIFLTFTENLLLKRTALLLPKDRVVIEIHESDVSSEEILDRCWELKKKGYSIALSDYIYVYENAAMLDYCDIVKVDFKCSLDDVEYTVRRCLDEGKTVIAESIESLEEEQYAHNMGCQLMQGYYFAQPLIMMSEDIYKPMALTFVRLVASLRRDFVNIDEVAGIISNDAFMTKKLLRLVNAMRSDMSQTISTVKQALIMIGVNKLNDWVYLIGLQKLCGGSFEERIKTALLRAMFCFKISYMIYKNSEISNEMYLMGLMSIVVNANDEDAMDDLSLSRQIKDGLMERETVFGDVMRFAKDYECANWASVDEFLNSYGLEGSYVLKNYLECVKRTDWLYSASA